MPLAYGLEPFRYISEVPRWTEELLNALRQELQHYNAQREGRPEVAWKACCL